jgi:RNA polymerase sigma factor (TIGR02999 family)
MRGKSSLDATRDLAASATGDPEAASRLTQLVYDDLRALAAHVMRDERPDHTLQPTALVHETYLRLIDVNQVDWQSKTHFIAMAARQMRRILVEHGRARGAEKRGGGLRRVTLSEGVALTETGVLDPLVLDEALEKLARHSPRQCQVAELRCFAGLEMKEVAYLLGVSERTIKRDWRVARAWLRRNLAKSAGAGS